MGRQKCSSIKLSYLGYNYSVFTLLHGRVCISNIWLHKSQENNPILELEYLSSIEHPPQLMV